MNVDQINEGEVRVFPYYRGEYMGTVMLGFSNEKSAKSYMKGIPPECVYEKFGGMEEYNRSHEYVPKLDKNKLFRFNPPSPKITKEYRNNWTFEETYDESRDERVYLKDLGPELAKEIRDDIEKTGFYAYYEAHEKVKEFQKKYDLFPNLLVDKKDYEKEHRRIMRDEVVLRKGIVHINVEFVDQEPDD